MERLSEVIWVEKTSFVDELLDQELTVSPIPAGLEANVLKFCSPKDCVVLKIWNKASNPDVHFQHGLLAALRHRGISVSTSYGWGYTPSRHKVLLTSCDGSPPSAVTSRHVKDFADLLLGLHRLSVQELDPALLKTYDFIPYLYPGIEEHQDIRAELLPLVASSGLKRNKLIHGDFNLGNILDNQGKYTIIDWTNAQLGDARYDLAWSSFLIHIYNGEMLASAFQNAYLSGSEFDTEEMLRFEAIACLRWLLLHRTAEVPRTGTTIQRVNDIIIGNKYLKNEIGGFP
ncbi:aminoglycoside phosphotransferase family protein [Paenibacillus tyrfis]|uniref:aminoglycoside phosphotransferase family protein n=1 Tax=Paenibacillus tyrfis TaxID=1501230 RepID=UPI00209F026C|nr:aminoglycoside phosphotransferase family protein [Paenibacillus tyrfis]MCP1308879.1 aminoglycoside phosphotransferase family protein [Paenibacillus tyrfis]